MQDIVIVYHKWGQQIAQLQLLSLYKRKNKCFSWGA